MRCRRSWPRPTRASSRSTPSSTTRPQQLRDASDLKSRFLSYMSHEFRTPLELDPQHHPASCWTALDGPLTDEQEKQVQLHPDLGRAS